MNHTNLISPNHKTTPILAFPRQMGEGTGLLIRQRGRLKITIYGISDDLVHHQTTPNTLPPSFPRRRESIGGMRCVWMVLKIFVARFLLLKIRFLSQPVLMNVRMAVVRQKFMPHPATCPLSRPAGEGWGEGGSMGCTNLIFPNPQSHPHPSLPPPDGGRNRIADTAKRSSENKNL